MAYLNRVSGILAFLFILMIAEMAGAERVGYWSTPIPLVELNDGTTLAGAPFLTEDKSTIYFDRGGKLFRAYQDPHNGLFVDIEEIVAESSGSKRCPWLSQDGQRLYYSHDVSGDYVIKMALWDSEQDDWVATKEFPEIQQGSDALDVCLSPDELTIYWYSEYDGRYRIYQAYRPDLESPFGTILQMDDLQIQSGHSAGPCVLPDGLTIYFNGRNSQEINGLYYATRASTADPFSNITRIDGLSTEDETEYFPHVTADEELMAFTKTNCGICESQWLECGLTVYVDNVNGNDSNTGWAWHDAVATIQRGIDIVRDGGTVWVKPGIYQESITLNGKAITVSGYDGAAVINAADTESTSINSLALQQLPLDDADSATVGVTCDAGETRDTVLRHLVICQGTIAVVCIGSSPTLENVTIADNLLGIVGDDDSAPYVANSILWNSSNDLINGQAHYCCMKHVTAGTGNKSFDPGFADAENLDYHLKSTAGRFMTAYEQWSEPRLLDELNDFDYTGQAVLGRLSSDNLTIYFQRQTATDTTFWRARRAKVTDDFGTAKEMEIESSANAISMTSLGCISPDNLRLYGSASRYDSRYLVITYADTKTNEPSWIDTTQFLDTQNERANPRHCSVSSDEGTLYFVADVEVGQEYQPRLIFALLDLSQDRFWDIRTYRFNDLTSEVTTEPWVWQQGRTTQIYYSYQTSEEDSWDIYMTQRVIPDGYIIHVFPLPVPFEEPVRCWCSTDEYDERNFFMSYDGTCALFYSNRGPGQRGLWQTYRNTVKWVADQQDSVAIDAGDPIAELGSESTPHGQRLNLGAYGGTSQASRTGGKWPNNADINRDLRVDLNDLAELAQQWLWQY